MKAIAVVLLGGLIGCSGTKTKGPEPAAAKESLPTFYHVDTATAGTLKGTIRYTGKKPARKLIDMSGDPACMDARRTDANHGKVYDESVVVNPNGTLANVFVYVKSGLDGKNFKVPAKPVIIDQKGCWFHPRVLGIQTGQTLEVTNSDPVTHNIHPMAQINREWNHSQGSGDLPLARKFLKQEVMIKVKCNIHSWMHAYIGALDHPYFAVTGADGSFEIPNLPPGDYVVEAWQETMAPQEQKVTVAASGKSEVNFHFKGE